MRKSLLLAGAGLLVIAVALAALLLRDGAAQARIRQVQAAVDPAIGDGLTMGELLGHHAHLANVRWAGSWNGDEQSVTALAELTDLDGADQRLTAPFRGQVARTPQWSGIAGDRPATVRVVFHLDPAATPAVRAQRVDLVQAWVVVRAEQVAAQEAAFARAAATSDDRSAAARFHLVRDGDRTLFDAGLHEPSLAATGQGLSAQAWLAVLAEWK